jgi:hypothetical protein
MSMLFCAASPGLHSFFTNEAYPTSYFLFPVEVDAVPNFATRQTDNKRETLKATHAYNHKTRSDIVTMTMNAALSDIFLANLPRAIRETYEPICMKEPNTVFLHMFDWFIAKYGKTITKDSKENQQQMAADWHPSKGFKPLATCFFIGKLYASVACYPMKEQDVINISLHVVKRCGMHSKEYKNWIAQENKSPPIVESIESFKEYWANEIAPVNQTAIPAANYGYGMTAVDDEALLTLYGKLLANLGATYSALQESIKNQATSMAAMQGQLASIQQFCMAIGQQPPSNGYAPVQQQCSSTGRCNLPNGGGGFSGGNGHGGFSQQPTMFSGKGAVVQQSTCPPTPASGLRIGTTATPMADKS